MPDTVIAQAGPKTTDPASLKSIWRRLRFVPLAIGAVAMAAGLWTGLLRLGVPLSANMPIAAELHGAFMIAGFLGTVISLERAVAVGRGWAYAAPALSAVGALALLADMPRVSGLVFVSASVVLLAASLSIIFRQFALFSIVLTLGAACWVAGTILWLSGSPMPAVVGWWLNFLILTIAAERLELSRIMSLPPSSQIAFAAAISLLLLGSVRNELADDWAPLAGAGLLGCAAWLLLNDVARRTIRGHGATRFSAVALLTGHAWLALAGGILLFAPAQAFSYDAAVHAIAIGFVLSMVFGHAPIILPAVTGLRVQYSDFAYVPLILLHASAILRVGSDLMEWLDMRPVSGVLTVVALIGYAGTLVSASRTRSPRRTA
jgi:hypothetical protein